MIKKMRNEHLETITRSSFVVEPLSQNASCDPLSISDSIEHSDRQLGTNIISTVIDYPTSSDTLFISLTRMSFAASDACSCSVSTLLANMSHDKGMLKEGCNDIDLIESVDGDVIIIDKILSIWRSNDEKRDEDDDKIHDKIVTSPGTPLLSDQGRSRLMTEDELDDSFNDFSAQQFERIGRIMSQQASGVSNNTKLLEDDLSTITSMQDSCSNFSPTDDLDKFTDTAKEILPHLIDFEPESNVSLPVPPLPPTCFNGDEIMEVYCPMEMFVSILPPAFICPLCQLPIVGAITFSCTQNHSFCRSCVEHFCMSGNPSNCNKGLLQQREDFVFCPMCEEKCNHAPCHALDVAILSFMMDLDPSAERFKDRHSLLLDSKSLRAFQTKFYERVLAWRTEVRKRKVVSDYNKQLWLLEYAQREKEEMQKYKEKTLQNQRIHLPVAAVSVALVFLIGTTRAIFRFR